MRTVLLENLRKRIILVIVGVAGYYLSPAPLGMLFGSLSYGELLTSLWLFYAYKGIGISFLIVFLYLALVKTGPSLVPKQKKYRHLIGLVIASTVLLSVLIPSGMIVEEWTQGQCITKSGSFKDDGEFRGTTSSGSGSELECIQSCIFAGKVSMNEEKTCKFNGLFGFAHWEKTPKDFADFEDGISRDD